MDILLAFLAGIVCIIFCEYVLFPLIFRPRDTLINPKNVAHYHCHHGCRAGDCRSETFEDVAEDDVRKDLP